MYCFVHFEKLDLRRGVSPDSQLIKLCVFPINLNPHKIVSGRESFLKNNRTLELANMEAVDIFNWKLFLHLLINF